MTVSYKDFLPKEQKEQKEQIKDRIEAASRVFLPGDGLVTNVFWFIERLCLPSFELVLSLMALKVFPGVWWFVLALSLVPWIGFVLLCFLQWNVCRLWIYATLAVMSLGLALNGRFLWSMMSGDTSEWECWTGIGIAAVFLVKWLIFSR